ncbi:MAG: hypothetical protein IT360_16010 [Gemmatimonadaceae bacterium]|nr:hypothetical protein [Gemmatimonadaceae bacterium]
MRHAIAGVATFFALRAAIVLATAFTFPAGGGEFHAMFAYSASGRIGTAMLLYAVYLGALLPCAVVLSAMRYPFAHTGIARIASAAGMLSWWPVCRWPGQSLAFRAVAVAGLLAMPWVMHRVCDVGAWRGAWRRRRWRLRTWDGLG